MEGKYVRRWRTHGIYRYAKDNPLTISDRDYYVRTTQYSIYPNRTQERMILHTLDVCRSVYNQLCELCRMSLNGKERIPSFIDLTAVARCIWNRFDWMQDIYENCLNDVARRVHDAFERYLNGRKRGENVGLPRFKSEGMYDSFTYPSTLGFSFRTKEGKKGGFERLRLGKIGQLRFGNRFMIPGTMKTATVSRSKSGSRNIWKVCITWRIRRFTEHEASIDPSEDNLAPVGLDLGLRNLVALSDRTIIPNDDTYRKKENRYRELQRRLSEAMANDSNYRRTDDFKRAHAKLSNAFRKAKDHRKDQYHKMTRDIVYSHGDIYAEALDVKEMIEGSESKTIKKLYREAAWSTFMDMLTYKGEESGIVIHKVNPAYTSQLCSECGTMVPKDLSVRVHKCPDCKLKLDRDINAARNILKRGLGVARHVRDQRQSASVHDVSTDGSPTRFVEEPNRVLALREM